MAKRKLHAAEFKMKVAFQAYDVACSHRLERMQV